MNLEALLIIDVQTSIFTLPVPLFESDTFLKNIRSLLAKARENKIQIIFVQHCGPKGSPFERGTPGWALHPALEVRAGELVIEKNEPDAFQGTRLDEILKARNIEKLTVCGFASPYCVDTSVRSAYSHGYKLTLVSDAHTTTDGEFLNAKQAIDHHNSILKRFAEVQSQGELIFRTPL